MAQLISKKHFRALQNYLDVLHRYFPGRRKVRDVIAAARRSLATFNGHIKGDQFAQLWQNAIEKEHSSWPDEIVNWKGSFSDVVQPLFQSRSNLI